MTSETAEKFTEWDQHNLNRYVGIVARRRELKGETKQLQEEIDSMRQARDELNSMEPAEAAKKFDRNYPPGLGMRWAETFSDWEPAFMAEYLEGKISEYEQLITNNEGDLDELTEDMLALRSSLEDK